MKLLLIILCCLALSCGPSATNTGISSPTPAVSPSPDPAEAALVVRERQEKDKVLSEFLASTYKGWTLQGVSNDFEICDLTPCDVHISKGAESKVIAVIIQKFARPDGSEYWLVREATAADFQRSKE